MIEMLAIENNLTKIPVIAKNKYRLRNIYRELKYFTVKKSNVKYFIVITRARSGSTCFMDLLSSHSQVLAYPHKFFNYTTIPVDFPKEHFLYSSKNIRVFKFRTQPLNFELNIDNAKKARQAMQDLIQKEVSLIHLERENLLNQAISFLRVKMGGKLHITKEKTPNANTLIIEPEKVIELIELFEKQANFDNEVLQGLPHISLTYEQDLDKQECHQNTLDKMCQAFGLDSQQARTKYKKIAPNKIRNYITNYDEVVEAIARSPFKKYLEY